VAKQKRSDDWGFPRWRDYGSERGASRLRLCDRQGCGKPGDFPAPKSPLSKDRWLFCQEHAAEYNSQWNYFAGLSDEEAAQRAAEEAAGASSYQRSGHWTWAGPGDGNGVSRAQNDAYRALDLEPGASAADVKASYRRLAKQHHPDANPGDAKAAERFQAVQTAYQILSPKAPR
jgi:DnaJ domain